MGNRRPLTAGLAVVPSGAPDAEAVKSFITQEAKPSTGPESHQAKSEVLQPKRTAEPAGRVDQTRGALTRKGRKSPMPVGLIPVTVRLKPEIAAALKRASLERQLAGEDIYTQQDLVELALEPWLKGEGLLS